MIKRLFGAVLIAAVLALVVLVSLHYNRYRSLWQEATVKADTTVIKTPVPPLPATAEAPTDSLSAKADTVHQR